MARGPSGCSSGWTRTAAGGRCCCCQFAGMAPDWGGLPAGYLLAADPFEPWTWAVKVGVQSASHPGQALRFRLVG